MRVAVVVPVFPQLSETFVVTKVLGLTSRGLDVHVVCSQSDDAQWGSFGPLHPVHTLRGRVHTSMPTHPRWKLPVTMGASLVGLRRHNRTALRRVLRAGSPAKVARHLCLDTPLIQLAPDVVHFEFGALAVGREDAGRQLDCALTVSFRGSDLAYVGLETPGFYDRLWGSLDRTHVLGEALWERARQRGAPGDTPHAVITPAVDAAMLSIRPPRPGPLGGRDRPLRVLSVGRAHWTKGYDDALESIAALHRQGVVAEHRIVGAGELLPAMAFWRHQLGLDGAVDLLGALPPDAVNDQYEWADVLLHSAVSEGFCNVVVEAQAHGLPVVCSDAGGLPENVEADVTGIVVPRRDPAALADGLARLASDDQLRAAMGAAGRLRVERLFGLGDHLDAWECFYRDALDHHRSPSSFNKNGERRCADSRA